MLIVFVTENSCSAFAPPGYCWAQAAGCVATDTSSATGVASVQTLLSEADLDLVCKG